MSECAEKSTALKAQLMRHALTAARSRIIAQSFTRWRVTSNFLSEIAKAPQDGLKMHLMEYKYKFNSLNKKLESYEREVNAARSELARQEISMAQERRSLLEQIEIARREGGGSAAGSDSVESLSWLSKVSERSLAERTRQALFGKMHRFGNNRAQIKQSAERVLAAMDHESPATLTLASPSSVAACTQPDSHVMTAIGASSGGRASSSRVLAIQSQSDATPDRPVSIRAEENMSSSTVSLVQNTASASAGPTSAEAVSEMEEYIVAQRNVIVYLTIKNALKALADRSRVSDVQKAFYKWMSVSFGLLKDALASKCAEVDALQQHYTSYEVQMKDHWEKTEAYSKSLNDQLRSKNIECEDLLKRLGEKSIELEAMSSRMALLEEKNSSQENHRAAEDQQELEKKLEHLNQALVNERRQSFVSTQSLAEASKALADEQRRSSEKSELINKLTAAISGLDSTASGDLTGSQLSIDQPQFAEDEQYYAWMSPTSKASAIDSLKLLSLRPSDGGRRSSGKPKERGRSRSLYASNKESEPLFKSSSMRRSSIGGADEASVQMLPQLPQMYPLEGSPSLSLSASRDSFDAPSKQEITALVFNPDIESAMNSKIPTAMPRAGRSVASDGTAAQSRATPSTLADPATPRKSSVSTGSSSSAITPVGSDKKPATSNKESSKSKTLEFSERNRNQGLQTADDFESSLEDVWRTISSTKVDSTPMSTNVRVAVRMRPFNARETDMSAQRVVSMEGNTVRLIEDLNAGTEHQFSFDFCFDAAEKNESKSTAGSQKMVFDRLGMEVLSHAWSGFNACLFAYGQTGSGKSYSMMGNLTDAGIIPRVCRALFYMISKQADPNNGSGVDPRSISVEADYLEIYNENIRDLLDATKSNLRVREHPTTGVFVENLSSCAVESYEDVEDLLAMGLEQRTTAATNMNSESSRSHSVFTISIRSSGYDENGNVSSKYV
jgi:hypothetical protein